MINYDEIYKLIVKRNEELEKIASKKEKTLAKAPEGMLRVAMCKNSVQYFRRADKYDFTGTYIKKKERNQAVALAQKEYDQKVIDSVTPELYFLKRLISIYEKNPVDLIASKMHPGKVALIRQVQQPDAEFVSGWLAQELPQNDHHTESLKYETAKGVKMRSKSEVLIANVLDEFQIPYLYEKPLRFDDGTMLLPDFTLLDVKNRKEVYLEHFGLIDEPEYMARTFEKIREYESNGYFLGQGLLITYESSDKPLDLRQFRRMIEEWLGVS